MYSQYDWTKSSDTGLQLVYGNSITVRPTISSSTQSTKQPTHISTQSRFKGHDKLHDHKYTYTQVHWLCHGYCDLLGIVQPYCS